MEKKIFCEECNHDVILKIQSAKLQGTLKGENIEYEGKMISNSDCSHGVQDEEIIDINSKSLNEAYRKYHNIIPLKKIRNLPNMYDIGKRPLSIVLGWGELTFTRYFDGDIPSNAYALILDEIYNSPAKFLEMLELRKEFISERAYQKSKASANSLIKKYTKTQNIFDYLCSNCEDSSPDYIYKLMYYVQGFHIAFFERNILEETCGLNELKLFYTNIDVGNLENRNSSRALSITEKVICDNVLRYFGCYSGTMLSKFIKNEIPPINALVNQDKIVNIEDIETYFKSVVLKYNMISPVDICKYTHSMFKLLY